MATLYSTQRTNQRATPKVLQSPTEKGHPTRHVFDWTADAAQNDTVEFVIIPKGARITQGFIDFGAFGASVTLAIGDGTTSNKYLTATSVASAGTASFAHTYALYGVGREEASAQFTLTGTLAGADPASGRISGWIEYILT